MLPEQDIRSVAEARLGRMPKLRPDNVDELLHELEVHQIELEMQNETLRQTQIALEASRDRYINFYDFAPTGYITLNRNAQITEINLTGAKLLGMERGRLLNLRFAAFIAPEDRDLFHLHFKSVLKHDGKLTRELSLSRGDGSRLNVQLESLHLSLDSTETVVRITIFDISERKSIEEHLLKSRRQLLSFIRHAPVSMAMFDRHMNYIAASKRWVFEYCPDRADITGLNHYDLFPDMPPEWKSIHQQCLNGVTHSNSEDFWVRADGSKHWIRWEIQPWRDEDEVIGGIIIFSENITMTKTHERQLKKLGFALNHVKEMVFLIDKDACFTYVNDEACRALGFTREELLAGMGIPDIDTGWTKEKWEQHWQDIECNKSVTFESNQRTKDGRIIPVEINANHIEFDSEFYSFGLVRDISERKRANAELQASLLKVEEKEHAKTRFLAAASHDMRQPIAAASLLMDTLKTTAQTQSQTHLINQLDQSMKVFSRMLDGMLDISKFDAGMVKPKITSFDLADIMIWLAQTFAQTAFNKKICLRLFFPTSKSLIVRSDISLVQSVLMNLVSNAIKYTDRGSILVSARLRGKKVLIQVWDTGIGISEADLSNVFDEFYQVANPQRNRESGLGLGLSICQRAMSVLGERIVCRSRLGHGSVFEFSLPLGTRKRNIAPLLTDVEPKTKDACELFFRDKFVVLVENDKLVAQAMSGLLDAMGGKVKCYANAEDALADADIDRADYYIVDYMLEGKRNGIQFLSSLRRKMEKPVKAVLMTGNTSTNFIRKAEMSDWPVVYKPVTISKLISKLGNQDERAV